MTELKFRAWDNVDKCMCYVSLDDFVNDVDEDVPSTAVFHFVLAIGREGAPGVMRYTGLKDKNGKEIYEGDIVTHDEDILEVKWENMRSDIENCSIGFWLGWEGNEFDPMPIEVIGNIYENPELLK